MSIITFVKAAKKIEVALRVVFIMLVAAQLGFAYFYGQYNIICVIAQAFVIALAFVLIGVQKRFKVIETSINLPENICKLINDKGWSTIPMNDDIQKKLSNCGSEEEFSKTLIDYIYKICDVDDKKESNSDD